MSKKWSKALEELKPYIFKIATPGGYGTGFQVFYPKKMALCGIATAYHVIDHAEEWEDSIKITHYLSGKSVVLKEKDRVIFSYPENDLAFILFPKNLLPLEESEPLLIGSEKVLKPGVETGWCGFPHIAPPDELCFFTGHISTCIGREDYYLVDGVAINGVSGGPAFYIDSTTDKVKISGVISAYRPNRIHGESHPGLSKVCSVEPYQDTLKHLRSKVDAEKKAEAEKEKRADKISSEKKSPKKATIKKKTKKKSPKKKKS